MAKRAYARCTIPAQVGYLLSLRELNLLMFSMSTDNQAQIKGDKGASIFVGIPQKYLDLVPKSRGVPTTPDQLIHY